MASKTENERISHHAKECALFIWAIPEGGHEPERTPHINGQCRDADGKTIQRRVGNREDRQSRGVGFNCKFARQGNPVGVQHKGQCIDERLRQRRGASQGGIDKVFPLDECEHQHPRYACVVCNKPAPVSSVDFTCTKCGCHQTTKAGDKCKHCRVPVDAASSPVPKLVEALRYPRFGKTSVILRKAGEHIDYLYDQLAKLDPRYEDTKYVYRHHLDNAANIMDEALSDYDTHSLARNEKGKV